jgi:hypothetical protein
VSTLASRPSRNREPTSGIAYCWFRDGLLWVRLSDGRQHGVPLAFYPTLELAADDARQRWQIIGDGGGIHWPALDVDLSLEGILRGSPEVTPRRAPALTRKLKPIPALHVRMAEGRWVIRDQADRTLASYTTQAEAIERALSTARDKKIWYVHVFNEADRLVKTYPNGIDLEKESA